jgi:hypothetical protein
MSGSIGSVFPFTGIFFHDLLKTSVYASLRAVLTAFSPHPFSSIDGVWRGDSNLENTNFL